MTGFFEKSNSSERDSLFDFSSSFFLWELNSGSLGRFHIESVTDILYEDYLERIALLNGVMACDVYGNDPLFHNPSYLYEASFTNNTVKYFRTFQFKTANTVGQINEIFKKVDLHEKYCTYRQLYTFSEIHEATVNGEILIGMLNYQNKYGKSLKITFPIKHINISQSLQEFQVETGKVIFYPDNFNNIKTAYIAFKNLYSVNFLILDSDGDYTVNLKANISIYAKYE